MPRSFFLSFKVKIARIFDTHTCVSTVLVKKESDKDAWLKIDTYTGQKHIYHHPKDKERKNPLRLLFFFSQRTFNLLVLR